MALATLQVREGTVVFGLHALAMAGHTGRLRLMVGVMTLRAVDARRIHGRRLMAGPARETRRDMRRVGERSH
ncbi:MAG: hypothetical protein OEZ42_12730, partial [Gemmatimonadota bacterium]|nr:hypothetical protein [Gemmatimonadota bacterium]